MPLKKPKALMNRRKHAEGEAVDLEDAEGVDVVLVPFDEGAVGHGPVFEGDHFAEGAASDYETADVLGKMTREAEELIDQPPQHAHGAILGVEADLAGGVFA